MKKTNNMMKAFAAIALSSAVVLSSCSKQDLRNQPTVQDNNSSNSTLASPIATWSFDSTFKEGVLNLNGVPHKGATFTATAQARVGSAAFFSPSHGYVSYSNTGSKLPKLTTGLTVDFWLFANPKTGGAQCVWAMPQSMELTGDPAFWPDHHVLLDSYAGSQQGDSGLIKVMFKANRNIPYNQEWTVVGGIPNFYHRWTHVQYSYNGATSEFTLIINGTTYSDHITLYTDNPDQGGVPLGNIEANYDPQGILFGAFQNQWKPDLFGAPSDFMLPFKGRIDNFKVFNKANF